MHNIVKILAAAAACLLVCSCSGSVTLDMLDKSYSTGSVSVNAQIPQLSGLSDKDFQDSVNKDFRSVSEELLNDFSKSAKETAEMSEFNIQTAEQYNKKGFLSVVEQIDYFSRKTHKNSCRITKNINTQKCCEVSLGDLFEDDGYIDVLNALLEKQIMASPDKYADLWQKPKISQNQCFYINADGLVLYYPPYELSYYERGFVEIPIDLSELSGCFKEEYRDIFLN